MVILFKMIVREFTVLWTLLYQKLMLKNVLALLIRVLKLQLQIKKLSSSVEISVVVKALVGVHLWTLKMGRVFTLACLKARHHDLILWLFSHLELLIDVHIIDLNNI
jgi:hypothetical protein